MAYTLTFSGTQHPSQSLTVNGSSVTSGYQLQKGDIIRFATGYNVYATGPMAYSAEVNGTTYSADSAVSTVTIKDEDIDIVFKASFGQLLATTIVHTIYFSPLSLKCNIIYNNKTLASIEEGDFGSAQKTLKCNKKILRDDVLIKFIKD